MSAHAIDLGQLVHPLGGAEKISKTEKRDEPTATVSGLPFEALYQALYAPEPTPEEILREQYLLECD